MSKRKFPKGWKAVKLGDILNEAQGRAVCDILNRPISDREKTKAIREYLEDFKEELEAKGFVVDFLAHAIPFYIKQSEQEAEMMEVDSIVASILHASRN
jgi:hypothetical protein